ncbi:hypothetical protein EIN_227910 [Entamoeba invadens IP1]|uniref:Guanine nucleotide-binding protein-like 3 N-terminal domain-containing protein n=1 Tax=Entamoeba invadens IP1 TaxID=370355 RepID=A0A0A1U8P7_ENTIV|nr:hypothetical protein EIN_227910 [Entamoeba invadens IP1]ELP88358.1 hypothetical protein EIN_227910 [Entamoeba invadens IP1]|eukprot:XP_004255129.1 hypothetical protein EIN_227910 [Entamoeba invadens IP1]
MPKIKPKNHHQKLSKKHSIEKKIGQHNQKMRRLAKKFPEIRRKIKTDPGVPHLCALKEQLVEKYENALKRKVEAKEQAREAAKAKKLAAKGVTPATNNTEKK